MQVNRTFAVGTLAMLIATSSVSVARADSKSTPTTQPASRTIAVYGSARQSFTTNDDQSQRQALAKATDAALADAKQKAERSAKILGVQLGLPITVGLPFEDVPSGVSRSAGLEVHVNIVFELLP